VHMRLVAFSLPPFMLVAIPILVIGGILFRRRRQLPWYYDCFLFLPFAVWGIVIVAVDSGKSLSNALVEPMIVGLVMGVCHWMFLAWPGHDPGVALRRLTLSVMACSVMAAFIAMWYPHLPE